MPEETLQASKDLKAKVLLPVHWGKFSLSTHPWTEPVERLLTANADEDQVIFTPQIGEVLNFGEDNITKKWWR
jgi:L-ascorbate metabolism protein UlaG (beta-lactamase superfamily)